MSYELLKSLHLIGVVCWFAGLFYIVRLFVYHQEAVEKKVNADILTTQYIIMEKRLWYGITWPSLYITSIFGTWLAMSYEIYKQPWFHLKLLFIILLIIYHLWIGSTRKKLLNGNCKYSSNYFRIFNEFATLFLVAIIFLAVFKNTLSALYGILGLFFFATALMIGIKIYNYFRVSA